MRIIIQDIKHLKLKQDLLWVGTTTLVTVILWVAFAIYTAFNKSTIDPSVNKLLEPLNPSLDQVALDSLKNRFVPPEEFTILVLDKTGNGQRSVPSGQTQIASSSGIAAPRSAN